MLVNDSHLTRKLQPAADTNSGAYILFYTKQSPWSSLTTLIVKTFME